MQATWPMALPSHVPAGPEMKGTVIQRMQVRKDMLPLSRAEMPTRKCNPGDYCT